MRKIVLFLLLGILCIGCGKSIEEKAIDKYYQDVLIDPKSFEIHSLKLKKEEDYLKVYELDYGAKNGFGAMSRETSIIEIIGDKVVSVDGKSVHLVDGKYITL